MITINEQMLFGASLPISTANDLKKMIEIASDHPAASTGQLMAYEFLKSLDGDANVNMADLLYRFEPDMLCACIKAKAAGYRIDDFYNVV